MSGMRRWLRSTAAKVLVGALLGIQAIPWVQACPMAMTGISMAYATTEMPALCAGMAKQGCLVSYLQTDRATGSDGATIAVHPASVLRFAPLAFIALVANDTGLSGWSVRAGAPPPRLLFCRMLE